jgi:7-cyano-7-deazaguanine synthase in queuosine biosynthesis
MKYLLGPSNLQTEFEFEIFKKIGKLTIVDNKIFRKIDMVGLFLSGGLDSAALLCLILTELKNINMLNEIPVVCFTVSKENIPTHYATDVLNYAQNKFNVSIKHINDIPNTTKADKLGVLAGSSMKFASEYSTNILVYLGQNKMAPDDIRPFSQKLNVDYGNTKTTNNITSPFLFLHKPQIVDLIYQLGCEDVISLTQSCSALPTGSCGICYACAERKWGFSALGKTDPGVNNY